MSCYFYSLSSSHPSQPGHLPSQKEKKSQQEIKADTASPCQWVCAYPEENDMVPKWLREFQNLLQHPGDSPVQKLACQQAAAFWLPTAQQKKDGWWTTSPCLEVFGWRKHLPLKDFQGTHDYREVRKEEIIALALALQSCAVW